MVRRLERGALLLAFVGQPCIEMLLHGRIMTKSPRNRRQEGEGEGRINNTAGSLPKERSGYTGGQPVCLLALPPQ